MLEFFQANILCLVFYAVAAILMIASIFTSKYKIYLLLVGLAIFIGDISFMIILGLSLLSSAILCGILVIITLLSIARGNKV